jgi:hypothetical protein
MHEIAREKRGEAHFDNDGADSGIAKLRDVLKNDDRFTPLIAVDEFWKNEYLNNFIHLFCRDYAKKHHIIDMFKTI